MSAQFDGVKFRRDVLAMIDGERNYQLMTRLLDERHKFGVTTQQLIDELTVLMLDLRTQGRDDEDIVMDLLDFLTGR